MQDSDTDPTDADPVTPPTIDENPSATGLLADEDEAVDEEE
jgi:hypothetical protein